MARSFSTFSRADDMQQIVEKYVDDLPGFVSGYSSEVAVFIVIGILIAVIGWTMGIAVHSIFLWFDDWTRSR